MNFRQLIDRELRKGVPLHLRPRTMAWLVQQIGVSRPQIYNLINGIHVAPSWTVARIAKGLDLTQKSVEAALAESRAECEVSS